MTKVSENDFTSSDGRAEEINSLVQAVQAHLITYIRAADDELAAHRADKPVSKSSLVNPHDPSTLSPKLALFLPFQAQGSPGLLSSLQSILQYSVNTFSPGFLDKLYASTNAPGIAADLILSVLNTNLHVYQVSPVLTLIESHTTKALASLFGLNGPRSGGISVQGGSASNTTSIVVARNSLYPLTKIHGNHHNGRQLVLFTSAHGHYSTEKAAQACGFGSAAVMSVPVDSITGAMDPNALESFINSAKSEGKTPFYINATAGTTVLGSFDPLPAIADIARRHNCWFHIDGSWGGSFIFSPKLRHKLAGSHLADSIAINPHKMLGVPLTCSFLLAKDLRTFHRANTLKAGYLFHGNDEDGDEDGDDEDDEDEDRWSTPTDLADLTLQCGRRGDSLKLFLSWQYFGTEGYARQVENAYNVATHLADLVHRTPELVLVSQRQPPCLQVCFYFAPLPDRRLLFGQDPGQIRPPVRRGSKILDPIAQTGKLNGRVTELIAKGLVDRGFMVDYAPALEEQAQVGRFFRVVVNVQTIPETVERLVGEVLDVGRDVVRDMKHADKFEQVNEMPRGLPELNGGNGIGEIMQRNPAERGTGPVVRERGRAKSTC